MLRLFFNTINIILRIIKLPHVCQCIRVLVDLCVAVTPGRHPPKTHPRDDQKLEKPPHLPMRTRVGVYLVTCVISIMMLIILYEVMLSVC